MRVADVAIVGGGPAGAAAAITLARAGRDVVIVDRARFPRDKCCGDGLTAGALRLLEQLALDPRAVATWQPAGDVVIRSPSGREITFALPRAAGTYAAVAQRRDLDAALIDRAKDAGVKVLDGHALTGAQQDDERVVLDVDGIGAVHARYAIGADGMWSPLRKALGPSVDGYLGEWHAFRQYFDNVTGPAADRLFVWFEPDLLPGYAWSFPLPGGRANVGFGIQRDGAEVGRGHHMKRLWPELLARRHVADALGHGATPEQPHKAWPIPARIDSMPIGNGRVLYAGDAAAACDPLTGEGIGQALLTGILAADAIEGAGPNAPRHAEDTYRRRVRGALAADHRMSMLLIRAIRHRTGARVAIDLAGATAWTRGNFARWLFEDYPRAVIVTPRRWHRTVFTGPGAFRSSRP